jgi:hypothetical protein
MPWKYACKRVFEHELTLASPHVDSTIPARVPACRFYIPPDEPYTLIRCIYATPAAWPRRRLRSRIIKVDDVRNLSHK